MREAAPNREAAIVSTARTPIGKAYRGAFNATEAPVLAGPCDERGGRARGDRPGADRRGVLGRRQPMGHARAAMPGAWRSSPAGLPQSVPAFTLDRKCGSGLTAIALAARSIICDEIDVALAGGMESISLTVTKDAPRYVNQSVIANEPAAYIPMIETAEIVAERYGISREAQDDLCRDEPAARLRRAAEGRVRRGDRADHGREGDVRQGRQPDRHRDGDAVAQDEGIRGGTTAEAWRACKTVWPGRASSPDRAAIDHRGQCQPAVGRRVGADPDGRARRPRPRARTSSASIAASRSAGASPTRWASARCSRSPSCSSAPGCRSADIGLWEINEAFASQCLYCRDTLGIDPGKLNVNGGAIAVGHPFGMTGSRGWSATR